MLYRRVVLLNLFFCTLSATEIYEESLVIKPLREQDILSLFNFTIAADSSTQDEDSLVLVPWLLRTLFQEHSIEHFQLSLTQGFWRSNLWGAQPAVEAPTGTFLSVKFSGINSVDEQWSTLSHQLNGIFCTSILKMNPVLTSTPTLFPQSSNGTWRYGQLSQESVCSENLKAWKKFLPCKQKGLVSLLEPRQLLSSKFHSISISADRQWVKNSNKWKLQFLAKTVHPAKKQDSKGLAVQGLFGREAMSKCAVASHSNVIIHQKEEKKPVLSVHTFTKSLSQSSGKLSTRIENSHDDSIQVDLTQMVPWQLRLFLHTLQFSCVYQKHWLTQPIRQSHYSLAKDMQRPWLLELSIEVPANAVCRVEVDYQTAFLKITDYPADANSGVYVPGPVLRAKDGLVEHGEPVLVLLPVPDFSMPFNVLCLVCTSIAIFYGNVVTTTTKLMKAEMKKEGAGEKKIKLYRVKEKLIAVLSVIIAKFKRKSTEKSNPDKMDAKLVWLSATLRDVKK